MLQFAGIGFAAAADPTPSKLPPRLMVQTGHSGGVAVAGYSADGQRIATGDSQGIVIVWDISTAKSLLSLAHGQAINSLHFTPDGKYIITTSMHSARIWDAETGKAIATVSGYEGKVSPDCSRIVLGSFEGTGKIVRVPDGETLFTLTGHSSRVLPVEFSREGTRAVTVSPDKTAIVWDVTTGKQVSVLKGHTAEVRFANFSPDGKKIVTGGFDQTARIWDAATGKELISVDTGKLNLLQVEMNADGRRLLTVTDQFARIWDTNDGTQIQQWEWKDSNNNNRGQFSPDGKLAMAGPGVRSKAYQIISASMGEVLGAIPGRGHFFTADSKQIVTLNLGELEWYDSKTRESLGKFKLEGSSLDALLVRRKPGGNVTGTAGDERIAILSSVGVVVWDISTHKTLAVLKGETRSITATDISANGKRLVACSTDVKPTAKDVRAHVWDLASGKLVCAIHWKERDRIKDVRFSPDAKLLVTTHDSIDCHLWNAETGEWLRTLPRHAVEVDPTTGEYLKADQGHTDTVHSARFSGDGKKIVTASNDRTARVWDTATGKTLKTLIGHGHRVIAADISPDGTRVVTSSDDNTTRVWNAETGKEIVQLKGHKYGAHTVRFSPDGKQVMSASIDQTFCTWDAESGRLVSQVELKGFLCLGAYIAADGKRIATIPNTIDNAAKIWSATGELLATAEGHAAYFPTCTLSPDNKWLLTGSADQTARLWDAATGREIAKIYLFNDDSWAIVDSTGKYDASNSGEIAGLHGVADNKPVTLTELKPQFYEPGWLGRLFGFKSDRP